MGFEAAAIEAGSNVLSTLLNQGFARKNAALQYQYQKKLLDYQWQKMYSPESQVSNLAHAGISPASAFGDSAPQIGGMASGNVDIPTFGLGQISIDSLANMLNAVANAKKQGVDTRKSEQEIKNLQVDEETKKFELELKKSLGSDKLAAEVALAWQKVVLANDSHDLNEIEKSLGEWKRLSAEALAQTDVYNRDIVKKVLDNKDEQLRLANRESEARGTASYASATESYAGAKRNKAQATEAYAAAREHDASAELKYSQKEEQDFFNDIRKSEGVRESLINEMRELGKQAQRKGWLTYYQVKEAEHAASQAAYADDMKEYTYWIDNLVRIIGSATNVFGVTQSMKHLNTLNRALGEPKISETVTYNAFGEEDGRSVTRSSR